MGYEMIGHLEKHNRITDKWQILPLKRYNDFKREYTYVDIWRCGRGSSLCEIIKSHSAMLSEEDSKAFGKEIYGSEDFFKDDDIIGYTIPLVVLEKEYYKAMYKIDHNELSEDEVLEEVSSLAKELKEFIDECYAVMTFTNNEHIETYDIRYTFWESY